MTTSHSKPRWAFPDFPKDRRGVWISPVVRWRYYPGTLIPMSAMMSYVVYVDARPVHQSSSLTQTEDAARWFMRARE